MPLPSKGLYCRAWPCNFPEARISKSLTRSWGGTPFGAKTSFKLAIKSWRLIVASCGLLSSMKSAMNRPANKCHCSACTCRKQNSIQKDEIYRQASLKRCTSMNKGVVYPFSSQSSALLYWPEPSFCLLCCQNNDYSSVRFFIKSQSKLHCCVKL